MTQLFDKIIAFTDFHQGRKNNERQANQDNNDFIDWLIVKAKEKNIKQCVFLGDWHDSRSSIHVSTLNYTYRNLKKLNDNFEKFYLILGNHDLHFREDRKTNSMVMAKELPNVVFIDELTEIDNVLFVPWLIGDEADLVSNYNVKYVFGHLELGGFYMNNQVQLPIEGHLSGDIFIYPEYVFSGHFHKRQNKGKIHYIGNCFPFDYRDVWDNNRGAMILEWGGKPEYIEWEHAPRFINIQLSDCLSNTSKFLTDKTSSKLTVDLPVNPDEVQFIRSMFLKWYPVRKLDFITPRTNEDFEFDDNIEFQNTNEIILEGLETMRESAFDVELLKRIYTEL
jgi:DNA repair exonuclease SbcCD nuclease subunit